MANVEMVSVLREPLVLMTAAVVAVPLARRLGLGAVLGYIAAGVAVGPWALGLYGAPERIHPLAELGVVLLLFVIGLELNPGRLWRLRWDIFGLGTAQVVLTGAALALAAALLLGLPPAAALVVGLGLALSSTALVVQMLEERNELGSVHGQASFAILLMQDIAVVPLLALVGFLAPGGAAEEVSLWVRASVFVGAVAAVVMVGHYVLNPVFRVLAAWGGREIMTAAALLVVLGAAALMVVAGLSMAMGAFLAGVLLAESTYRHELEADIEPFRGLLLGLFFMSVGMGLELPVVAGNLPVLLAGVTGLMAVKAVVLYLTMRAFRHGHDTAVRASLALSQGGEFGFVLFAAAAAAGVLAPEVASLLVAVVALSMVLTPFVTRLGPRLLCRTDTSEPEEDFADAGGSVLMIGFGRFGQLAAQLLLARGFHLTIIDNDVARIEEAARFGDRIYYGDGTRLDVLRAAGAERVRLIAVCTDRVETTNRVVEIVRESYPGTPCVVRSYDRRHALELRARGIDGEVRETLESALVLGREALVRLGIPEEAAEEIRRDVRRRDHERLEAQASGDFFAGIDRLRVRPEPLTPPRRAAAPAAAEAKAEGGE